MIEIVEAKQASDELCAAFRSLIPQLTTTSEVPARDELQAIIEAEATKVLLAIDDSRTTRSIVGVLTLVLYRIPTRKVARIEDLVVDHDVRRQGIAELLLRHALGLAKEAGTKSVDLTSNPDRVAAIRLYSKLGFVKWNTNLFRYSFRTTQQGS
ncbi:MAG: GNAT family N-acetyltransferase [Anaerolineales bacterium]|jgi:ribosomal protein S18 acetylase RimI-like enzyme